MGSYYPVSTSYEYHKGAGMLILRELTQRNGGSPSCPRNHSTMLDPEVISCIAGLLRYESSAMNFTLSQMLHGSKEAMTFAAQINQVATRNTHIEAEFFYPRESSWYGEA